MQYHQHLPDVGGLAGETAPVTQSPVQGQTGPGLPPPIHHQVPARHYVASELQHKYFEVWLKFLLWLVADTSAKVTQYIQANAVVFVPGCLVHLGVQMWCWKHLVKTQELFCMQETWHITALTTLHVLQQLLNKA